MGFTNKNVCKTLQVSGVTGAYTTCDPHPCSEAVVVCQNVCFVKVSTDEGEAAEMRVPADTPMTFLGITDTSELSIQTDSANKTVYVRAQYWGSMTPAI